MSFSDDITSVSSIMPYSGLKRWFITRVLRFFVKRQLYAQGTGRHNKQEVENIAQKDMEALSNYLGELTLTILIT